MLRAFVVVTMLGHPVQVFNNTMVAVGVWGPWIGRKIIRTLVALPSYPMKFHLNPPVEEIAQKPFDVTDPAFNLEASLLDLSDESLGVSGDD